jgi:hypothetical protein
VSKQFLPISGDDEKVKVVCWFQEPAKMFEEWVVSGAC